MNRRLFLIGICGVCFALLISVKVFFERNKNKKNLAMVEFEGWILTISDKEKLLQGQLE